MFETISAIRLKSAAFVLCVLVSISAFPGGVAIAGDTAKSNSLHSAQSKRIESLLALIRKLREDASLAKGYGLAEDRYDEIRIQLDRCEKALSAHPNKQEILANEISVKEIDIELMIAAYGRVKKIQITPSTEDVGYALYYTKLKKKIEHNGTCNFPQKKNGEKLYGELILYIPISHDGKIYMKNGGAKVEQSSGNRDLDAAALEIVKMSEPFEPIPAEYRTPNKEDVWEIITDFNFTRSDTQGPDIDCNKSDQRPEHSGQSNG